MLKAISQFLSKSSKQSPSLQLHPVDQNIFLRLAGESPGELGVPKTANTGYTYSMPKPSKLGKINFSSLSLQESLLMSQLIDNVNILGGHSGEVELSNHLNLSGNKITNVGPAVTESDVLTSGVAETKYSAAALQPKLQANSKTPLATYRMLNSGTQRENSSSWLNNLLSTPPNSNTINPIVSSVGGSTTVTIPASILQMGDGSKRYLPSRTDTLTNPASYSISTFTVLSGVATVNLSSTPVPPLTATRSCTSQGPSRLMEHFQSQALSLQRSSRST